MTESLTLGRAKRSTAGNRMRELLEKAHQQDDDELFKEEEGDEEFAAPADIRDVYLDEFADTDDEVEDEEAEERDLRREEKRKVASIFQAKGKGKAAYNPLAGQPKPKKKIPIPSIPGSLDGPSAGPSSSKAKSVTLLDPAIDPSTMAPSTLVLALRKQRRDAMRLQRSEARRSNLRASTLKTDADIEEREKAEKVVVHRKGRVAMHKGGEARGVRNLTQAELIAEALEEEERNKEELQKWLRREEERRELRRVGRKRVRGPRWTWISRTVGKMVEMVDEGGESVTKTVEVSQAKPEGRGAGEKVDGRMTLSSETRPQVTESTPAGSLPLETAAAPTIDQSGDTETVSVDQSLDPALTNTGPSIAQPNSPTTEGSTEALVTATHPGQSTEHTQKAADAPVASSSMLHETSAPQPIPTEPPLQSASTPGQPPEPSQYMRNYIILSQIPGGLPAEMAIILGSHVDWDQITYVPSRARPVNRRRPRCPFTGKIAKYRHPATMIPYADVGGYQQIEAMLSNRYLWSDGAFWLGGEEDVSAPEAEEIEGWREAMHGGWMGGFSIPIPLEEEVGEEVIVQDQGQDEMEEVIALQPAKKGRKRMSEAGPADGQVKTAGKGKKRRRG